MSSEYRKIQWRNIGQTEFDVAVIGGGISGAAIFHYLSAEGYRVLLIDKGDFAGGTSQASSMMIWASLPDLCRLSFVKVGRFCSSRERLMREKRELVFPQTFRFLPTAGSGRKPLSAFAALYLYWLLGAGRRSFPRFRKDFTESSFLNCKNFPFSFEYEEAFVAPSDARFVLEWLLPQFHSSDQTAFNYCSLRSGYYDRAIKHWHLELADSILGIEKTVKAKWIVNATGTWADTVNRQFGIETPYKHAFGKGVFIGIKRDPHHLLPLMIETKEPEGCMALIPWGPISLWGPTETRVNNLEEGFSVKPEEIRFLLKELNRHLSKPISMGEIVSLRCGVRPLVVNQSFPDSRDTLSVPREFRVFPDKFLPWLSIYGGKLTSCVSLAESVKTFLRRRLIPSAVPKISPVSESPCRDLTEFPNLNEKVPSARWCAEKEMCWNLEDYLRRRTNISQWVARGGLGFQNENLRNLKDLALIFAGNDKFKAQLAVCNYQRKIESEFDKILETAA